MDYDEVRDSKAVSVLVSDQAPFHYPDDRMLEELHIDLAVHQTVEGLVVAIRQADPPHITVPPGDVETENLQTEYLGKYRESVRQHNYSYLHIEGD